MIETNNTPQSKEEIKQHIKDLDKVFYIYIIIMALALALPIIELAVIYAVDYYTFSFISFMLMIASVFIFYQAFKGASLAARELVIYESMIEDQDQN